MSTSLRPRLVNGRDGDPALFVEFSHQREAVLLDMGDLSALSARDLLRVGTIGVSHVHMDQMIGFDALLRVNVGRDGGVSTMRTRLWRAQRYLEGAWTTETQQPEPGCCVRTACIIHPRRSRLSVVRTFGTTRGVN